MGKAKGRPCFASVREGSRLYFPRGGGKLAGMMRLLMFLAVVLLAGSISGCRRIDMRTVTIQVPAMKNSACADRVIEAIGRELYSGPDQDVSRQRIRDMLSSGEAVVDLTNRTVTVRYDSLRLSLKNLEFAVAEAGFDANNTPASEEAVKALPPECL
ncbi:MAG: heavy-metal-associated domain-containing protein [Lentisphaerae bacterium]|nr:heavy-metal-associated domain-containing protein [Lentisphaerota bacterium]